MTTLRTRAARSLFLVTVDVLTVLIHGFGLAARVARWGHDGDRTVEWRGR